MDYIYGQLIKIAIVGLAVSASLLLLRWRLHKRWNLANLWTVLAFSVFMLAVLGFAGNFLPSSTSPGPTPTFQFGNPTDLDRYSRPAGTSEPGDITITRPTP